jgi:hypothetical protein
MKEQRDKFFDSLCWPNGIGMKLTVRWTQAFELASQEISRCPSLFTPASSMCPEPTARPLLNPRAFPNVNPRCGTWYVVIAASYYCGILTFRKEFFSYFLLHIVFYIFRIRFIDTFHIYS